MANNLCTYRPQFRKDAPALEQRVGMRGQTGGYLNPPWVEWLMGFPSGWLHLLSAVSATRSSRRSRKSSAA